MDIQDSAFPTTPPSLIEDEIRQIVRDSVRTVYIPPCVYRLQFNSQFTFRDSIKILPYLKELGIDAVYASPYFQAKPGSNHGYDVINQTRINPEIGSEKDFDDYCSTLQRLGMKQILDVVPNHMGIRGGNPLWMDVLENGPSSMYAHFFDIDWEPKKIELKGKVLIPVLGDHYGVILENAEIQLRYEAGSFSVYYWDLQLPINPHTYPQILEPGLDELKNHFKEDDRDFLEYQSVITAFRNLPDTPDRNPEKIRERHREKEIAKERLAAITERSEAVRNFILKRVEILNGEKENPKSFDALDNLLNEQAYRMAFWRVAAEEINYRRFFDTNDLAALRVEDKEVFEYHHRLIFQLIQTGRAHGLRIDHPDGLYDPPAYFKDIQRSYLRDVLIQRLRPEDPKELDEKLNAILQEDEFRTTAPLFVVVEKILERKETLPEDWKVHGTVGYDFMNALNGLFVDQTREKAFTEIYENFIGRQIDFDHLIYSTKKFFALVHMSSEINMLAHRLDRISERSRNFRDFTLNNLTVAIREVIASFPVYRTYITPQQTQLSERDEKYIHIAVEKAKHWTPALIHSVYEFLKKILTLKLVQDYGTDEERLYRDFILRFQQLTGPVMAKGLEDTAFYVYNRLVSLNEAGGDPTHFGTSVGDFHSQNRDKNKRWPASFNASSTHDTKRSEDARMRINVLSEIPEEWATQIQKWSLVNEKHKTLIDGALEPRRNTEYFLYQNLLAVWPNEPIPDSGMPAFQERIWNFMQKAVREAKTDSNWVNPNLEYEEAVKKFTTQILTPGDENLFLKVFLPFQKRVSDYGMLNSLSAVILRVASPGVAETYQGNELWNYSLVDPDNRRPVDYESRKRILLNLKQAETSGRPAHEIAEELMRTREDGRIKLFIFWKAVKFCKQNRDVFVGGDYIPLKVTGPREKNVIAFIRKNNGKAVLVLAGRFFTEVAEDWQDTCVLVPKEIAAMSWTDILTGISIPSTEEGDFRKVPVAEAFRYIPAAMLTAN